MFKQRKHYNKSPMRRKVPGVGAETYRGTRTPITFTWATDALPTDAIVTFDQAVVAKGTLPAWSINSVGVTLLSATMETATTARLHFSGSIATASLITVPFEDPTFRNSAGGYVNAGLVEGPVV